jgi:hypothetical protein
MHYRNTSPVPPHQRESRSVEHRAKEILESDRQRLRSVQRIPQEYFGKYLRGRRRLAARFDDPRIQIHDPIFRYRSL